MSNSTSLSQLLQKHDFSLCPNLLSNCNYLRNSWNMSLAQLDAQQVDFKQRYEHELGSQIINAGRNHSACYQFCRHVILYALIQNGQKGLLLQQRDNFAFFQECYQKLRKSRINQLSQIMTLIKGSAVKAEEVLPHATLEAMISNESYLPLTPWQKRLCKQLNNEIKSRFENQYRHCRTPLFLNINVYHETDSDNVLLSESFLGGEQISHKFKWEAFDISLLANNLIANHLRLLLPQVYLTLRELSYYYPQDQELSFLCTQASLLLGYEQSARSYMATYQFNDENSLAHYMISDDNGGLLRNSQVLRNLYEQVPLAFKGELSDTLHQHGLSTYLHRLDDEEQEQKRTDEFDYDLRKDPDESPKAMNKSSSEIEDDRALQAVMRSDRLNAVWKYCHTIYKMNLQLVADKDSESLSIMLPQLAAMELDAFQCWISRQIINEVPSLADWMDYVRQDPSKQPVLPEICHFLHAKLHRNDNHDNNNNFAQQGKSNAKHTAKQNSDSLQIVILQESSQERKQRYSLISQTATTFYQYTPDSSNNSGLPHNFVVWVAQNKTATAPATASSLSASLASLDTAGEGEEKEKIVLGLPAAAPDAIKTAKTATKVSKTTKAKRLSTKSKTKEIEDSKDTKAPLASSGLTANSSTGSSARAITPSVLPTDSLVEHTFFINYESYVQRQELQRYFLEHSNFLAHAPFSGLLEQGVFVTNPALFDFFNEKHIDKDELDEEYILYDDDDEESGVKSIILHCNEANQPLRYSYATHKAMQHLRLYGDYDLFSELMAMPLQSFTILCREQDGQLPLHEAELRHSLKQGPTASLAELYQHLRSVEQGSKTPTAATVATTAAATMTPADAADIDATDATDVTDTTDAVDATVSPFIAKLQQLDVTQAYAGHANVNLLMKELIRSSPSKQDYRAIAHSEQTQLLRALAHNIYLFHPEVKLPFLEHLVHLPEKWQSFGQKFMQALESLSSRMDNPWWQQLYAQFSLGVEHVAAFFFYEFLYTPFLNRILEPEFKGYNAIDVDYARMVDQCKNYPLWFFNAQSNKHEFSLFTHLQVLEPPVQTLVLRYVQDYIHQHPEFMPADLQLQCDPLLPVQSSLMQGNYELDLEQIELFVGAHLSAEQQSLLDQYAHKDRYYVERYRDALAESSGATGSSGNASSINRQEVVAYGEQAQKLFMGEEPQIRLEEWMQKSLQILDSQQQFKHNTIAHYLVSKQQPRLTLVVYCPNFQAFDRDLKLQARMRHYLQALVGPTYFYYFVKEIYYISLPEAFAAFRAMSLEFSGATFDFDANATTGTNDTKDTKANDTAGTDPEATARYSEDSDSVRAQAHRAALRMNYLTQAQRDAMERLSKEAHAFAVANNKYGVGVGDHREDWAHFNNLKCFVCLPLNRWAELVNTIKPKDMDLNDCSYLVAYTSATQCNVHKIIDMFSTSRGRKQFASYVDNVLASNKSKGKNKKKKNKGGAGAKTESLSCLVRSYSCYDNEELVINKPQILMERPELLPPPPERQNAEAEDESSDSVNNINDPHVTLLKMRSDLICGVSKCWALSRQFETDLLYLGSLGNCDYLQALGIKAQTLILKSIAPELELEMQADSYPNTAKRLVRFAQELEQEIAKQAPDSVSVIGYAYGRIFQYVDLIFWDPVKGREVVEQFVQKQQAIPLYTCCIRDL